MRMSKIAKYRKIKGLLFTKKDFLCTKSVQIRFELFHLIIETKSGYFWFCKFSLSVYISANLHINCVIVCNIGKMAHYS